MEFFNHESNEAAQSMPNDSNLAKSSAGGPPAKIPPPVKPPDDGEGEGGRMGFMDHLMELRRRLWKSAVAVFLCMVVALVFYSEIWDFMRAPLDRARAEYDLKVSVPHEIAKKLKISEKDNAATTNEFQVALATLVEQATATRTEVLQLLKVPATAEPAAINTAIDNLIKERDANDPKALPVIKQIAEKLSLSEKATAKEFQDALGKHVENATATRVDVLQMLKVPPTADAAATNAAVESMVKERDAHRQLLKKLNLIEGISVVEVTNTSPLDTMMMVMWMGIGAGLVLASPIIFYEIWAFVSPGLRQKEKSAIIPILFGGIFFFIGGCAIAYEWLFPFSLNFFVWLDLNLGIRPLYSVDKYSTLLFNMLWMTGLVCEIPLVIAGLAKLGLVKASTLTNYWRVCILISFILGSLFSPGSDIMSMLVFSALLLSLYVLSIVMAWIFFPKEVLEQERKIEAERKREEEEERRKQQ